jgi:hypothetical protein
LVRLAGQRQTDLMVPCGEACNAAGRPLSHCMQEDAPAVRAVVSLAGDLACGHLASAGETALAISPLAVARLIMLSAQEFDQALGRSSGLDLGRWSENLPREEEGCSVCGDNVEAQTVVVGLQRPKILRVGDSLISPPPV